ncbi:metalloprotease [Microdochium trichocladiopsis]|uniref:Metalloprotease n=1 Tax=Microdochium trichocladiopsis TaxID=1682393 RepID=A0A9P8Y5T5_9PEZI|nr:metalloprotease [Microdochium trichocladiopsis]KAH7028116.1 metalloprotease [Microdochium trichocladiopsis]
MAHHRCFVVPPYLLSAIADSSHNSDALRESARRALQHQTGYAEQRQLRLQLVEAEANTVAHPQHTEGVVPLYLLQSIADSPHNSAEHREAAHHTLGTEQQHIGESSKPKLPHKLHIHRAIYDAQHSMNEASLPGEVCRVEGQQAVKDDSVNEAYENTGKVLDFYAKLFHWNSYDNKNAPVKSSVHFGKHYENAFWDSEARQMVYGDGHDFLTNFTGAVDVIGHELTHAVTEHTSRLAYVGQAGALNESVSDVFGIMIKQLVQNEKAEDADWLIGEDCICPGVKGVALRSMKAPGTAYNDPRFGKDPQPAHMRDYRVTTVDNGGVHLYSGIPNKAFQLTAVGLGGYSWEKAGKIWWKTVTGGLIGPNCNFLRFADATVNVAEKEFGDEAATIVRNAWKQVGVVRKEHA